MLVRRALGRVRTGQTGVEVKMMEETPLLLVETTRDLKEVADSLALAPVIGIDTESDSFHHYQERVCLIQISDGMRDIIVDPLHIEDMSPLGEILGRPEQVKVLHGADYDVVCLKRDYGFEIRNLFDTMIASQFLSLSRVGLADVLQEIFGVVLDKRYQRYDWAKRPLLQEHLTYARNDTHWLIALREVLMDRLARVDRLDAVMEECERISQREWSGRKQDPADFLKVKGAGVLDAESQRVLRQLFMYRDEQARRMNRPVFKVIPDPVLLAITRVKPREFNALAHLVRANSPLMRAHGQGLLKAVSQGLLDQEPLPEHRRVAPQRRASNERVNQVIVERLRLWRNERVGNETFSAAVVVSNGVIREIAQGAPKTLEQLAALPDVRAWQVRIYGQEILDVVREATREFEEPLVKEKRRRKRKKSAETP